MDCTNKKLRIVYGDLTLGVHGEDLSCLFSYGAGGLESLTTGGVEWLYRVPKPTFWRALTDNDRGNRFQLRSGMWLSADMFINCKEIALEVDGRVEELPVPPSNNRFTGGEEAEKIRIIYTYETITVPTTLVEVAYEISAQEDILVKVHYHGQKGLPELPVFGMRFIMPDKAEGFLYEGLSGETYPDRMAGGVPGTYEVKGLPVADYLVPQDCGVHMKTNWVKILRKKKPVRNSENKEELCGLQIAAVEEPFAFSCLPYTAEELENATHKEELPPARRTVLSVLGAVRGVGGINSWGAQTEEPYRISAEQDIRYAFRMHKA